MKHLPYLMIVLFLLSSLLAHTQVQYMQKDKEILDEIFDQLLNEKDKSTAELVVLVGKFFRGIPYVANTLETEPEQLLVNLRELDCTTLAENCLAIARTIKSKTLTFDQFVKELTNIRYRNGIINGYPSRLHYFSDWVYENNKKGMVTNISQEIANTPYPLELNFMSTHPNSYVQLKKSPDLLPVLEKKEKEISERQLFYIPKNKIPDYEYRIKDGDIVGITTSIKGLDITHVGILVKQNGQIHLMHASSLAKKVVVSENTLYDYLQQSKTATGIMISRPL